MKCKIGGEKIPSAILGFFVVLFAKIFSSVPSCFKIQRRRTFMLMKTKGERELTSQLFNEKLFNGKTFLKTNRAQGLFRVSSLCESL